MAGRMCEQNDDVGPGKEKTFAGMDEVATFSTRPLDQAWATSQSETSR